MSESITVSTNYDVALANLFYAMTMADRAITRDEKLQIAAFLQKHWSKNTVVKQTDALMFKTLKELITRNVEAQKAFLVFSEFFYRNKKLFDSSLKAKIKNTCEIISQKKGKRSKSELIFVSKLYAFFNPPEDLMPLSYHYDED